MRELPRVALGKCTGELTRLEPCRLDVPDDLQRYLAVGTDGDLDVELGRLVEADVEVVACLDQVRRARLTRSRWRRRPRRTCAAGEEKQA